MPTRLEYTSFLVRFWRRVVATEGVVLEWRGEVEHIQTGQRWTFDNAQALVDFLSRRASRINTWYEVENGEE